MRCRLYHAAVFLMILPVFAPGFAEAQVDEDDGVVVHNPAASGAAVPPPITDAGAAPTSPIQNVSRPKLLKSGQSLPSGSGYAVLDAPLYPCPTPGVPLDVGATMITNPAFAPHEMLYPHKYRGLYAPFYYKTRRTWVLTPLGVYKKEHRVLTGTEVIVKYKPSVGIFNLYTPPPTHGFSLLTGY